MSDPLTINFGPWSPDLQNIPVGVLPTPMPLTIPCADVLNCYYQDGAYRCLPGLNPFGPALGVQCLQAFNWYDNTQGLEMVFGATQDGISKLVDNLWQSVGVENIIQVAATPWASLRTGWQGLNTVAPWKAKTTWTGANVSVIGGTILNSTLHANISGNNTGYQLSSFGSLTPAVDSLGNTVKALYNNFLPGPNTNRTVFIMNATVPQAYFTVLSVPTLGINLPSSTASFSQSGGTTTWLWSSALGVANGANYGVVVRR